LLNDLKADLDFPVDLTFELIMHRFTPGSKKVLTEWYPNTSLDLNEEGRDVKRNKFGGTKYVYTKENMREMKEFFYSEIQQQFPESKILYWT
jgi:spore photoproduct lyase